jgi:predicted lipoprotein with Yx(FWY)xxD motif
MRSSLPAAGFAAVLALLAGCGSSSKSTTSSSGAAASGSSTAAASSAYGHSPYGAGATTATASGSAASAAASIVVSAKHGKLGTLLAAGPKKRTVYLFEGDTASTSACAGTCPGIWPPVTTTAAATAAGGASRSALGTITRPDGSKQVTYNGHPLYYFANDKDESDSYGQGIKSFGSSWYVLAPTGKKIDKS